MLRIELDHGRIAYMSTRLRRGYSLMPDAPLMRLEQEYSLEMPLGYATSAGVPGVAVVLHAFHTDLVPELRGYLDHIPVAADLFVSTDTEQKCAILEASFATWNKGAVQVSIMPNRGRDIAPKLIGFSGVHDRYEYVLHLHTKMSPHDSRLVGWRGYLLDTLLGSPAVVHGVFEAFAAAPELGMIAPQHIEELRPWIQWGANHSTAEHLARRMGFELPDMAPLDFPSGSMFWARSAALRPLLDLRLSLEDFAAESGQTDGTLAHAIERLYFLVCEHAGFDWLKITARGELHEQGGVTAVSSRQELYRFIIRHRHRLSALRDQQSSLGGAPVIISPPPKPRRVLHVAWRTALGEDVSLQPGRRVVIALHGEAAASSALVRSAEVALQRLPAVINGQVLALPGATRARALQEGFAADADLVVLVGAPGLLHPQSVIALLRMSERYGGRTLLEVACVPVNYRQTLDQQNFSVQVIAGPMIAVPRPVFDATNGYDESLEGVVADQDLSQRTQAHGLGLALCPRALFYATPAEDGNVLSRGQMAPGIDIITRLYDSTDLPLLNRLVFSIMGQSGHLPLRVHIMLQRFSISEVQLVREAIRYLGYLNDRVSLTLHNWDLPAPFDLRVPLLNWGLELAQDRYIMFIDVNEQLYPNACSALFARLCNTGASVALGGGVTQAVCWWGDVVLPVPAPAKAQGSTPLFMIDKKRIDIADRAFRVSATGCECDEFINRISVRHDVDRNHEEEALFVRQNTV